MTAANFTPVTPEAAAGFLDAALFDGAPADERLLDAWATIVAQGEALPRERFWKSTYEGFTGCTTSDPDNCACATHTDPECEVCGETIEAGEEVVDLTRAVYPLMADDDAEQEWENHTAHARCSRAAIADQPEQVQS